MTEEQNDFVDLFNGLDHQWIVETVNRYLVPFGKKIVFRDPALDCLEFCDRLNERLKAVEVTVGLRATSYSGNMSRRQGGLK